MRILVLCTETPDRIWGGRGTHVKYLYEAMRGLCEIHYVSLDTVWGEHWYPHSTPWEESQYWQPFDGGIKNMLANTTVMLKHCIRVMQSQRFDVIHAHEWDMQEVALHLRDLFGTPIVSTFHLFQNELSLIEPKAGTDEDRITLVLERLGVYQADRVILVSEAMARYARLGFLASRHLDVILNGVDLAEFESVKPRVAHDGPTKALYCGRIAYQKGIEPLIAAIEQAPSDIEFTIMGKLAALEPEDAAAHPYARALQALHDAGKCRWIGHVDGPEKVKEFERCDCVVMPSMAEPFGIVALEAMAAGRPLLQTGVDGLAEFCSDENSIHIEPTAESIIGGIRRARVGADGMVQVGRETAARPEFNWKQIAERVAGIYAQVASHQQPSAQCDSWR